MIGPFDVDDAATPITPEKSNGLARIADHLINRIAELLP